MLPADGRCLASCPIELATMTAAIKVRTMESGNAPPANPAATASEVATAAPGAMNVTDWNSTPGRPTVCRARPLRPGARASGRVGVGVSGAAMRTYSLVRLRRLARPGETSPRVSGEIRRNVNLLDRLTSL